MKTTSVVLALFAALAFVAAIPACSGGDGGGGGGGCPEAGTGGTLTTGSYEVSCWHQVVDECAGISNINGETVSITVTGTALQLGAASGLLLDSSFSTAAGTQTDFNDDPYGFGATDCVVNIDLSRSGNVKGNDVADIVETYDVTVASGAGCDAAEEGVSDLAGANIHFPCHSESTFRITKVP